MITNIRLLKADGTPAQSGDKIARIEQMLPDGSIQIECQIDPDKQPVMVDMKQHDEEQITAYIREKYGL